MPAAAHLAVGYARGHLSVSTNELRLVQYDFLHDLFVKRQLVDKAAGCPPHTHTWQQQHSSSSNSSTAATSVAATTAQRWRCLLPLPLHNKFANHVMLQLQCRDLLYIFYAPLPLLLSACKCRQERQLGKSLRKVNS